MSMPGTLRRPTLLTRDGDDHGDEHDTAVAPHFHIGGVEPDIGPGGFDWTIEEGLDPLLGFLAQLAKQAFRDPPLCPSPGPGRDRAGRSPRMWASWITAVRALLRHPPPLEKAGKAQAFLQLNGAQFHRPDARLPVPMTMAAALDRPI